MSYSAVGLGSTANDGTGDTLRSAGTKINANDTELYSLLGGTGISGDSGGSASSGATLTSPIIATRITLADDVRLKIGTGTDLEIYHSSNNTYIENNTGELYIQGDGITIRSDTGTETMITAVLNGGVVLYYDNSVALTCTATGVTIAGDLTISGDDLIMATNTNTYMLVANGTNYSPVAMSSDATISNSGALTIANDAITQVKMADDAVGYDELESVQSLIVYASTPTTATANANGGTSTTTLVVDGNVGTIATGMVVSGTGVSTTNPPSIVTVTDQNNLVLSHAGNTIANDAALTFTAAVKILRGAGDAA